MPTTVLSKNAMNTPMDATSPTVRAATRGVEMNSGPSPRPSTTTYFYTAGGPV